MATPILEKVSKDLAYKLQDPVSTGTTNGSRLTANNRLRYIAGAYRRLLRTVTMLYPVLINKLFQRYFSINTFNTDGNGSLSASQFAEVFTVYCKEPTDEEFTKATWIPPNDFIDVKQGYSDFYNPDLNVRNFYYSIVGGNILVLPAISYNLEIMFRENVASIIEADGYGGDNDIDIPTEHTDLLLGFAAAEAYMDIGQGDMIQIFMQDVAGQLQILAGVKQEKDTKDEENNP